MYFLKNSKGIFCKGRLGENNLEADFKNKKQQWGILDIIVILALIFLITNLFTWLTAKFVKSLVIIQSFLIATLIQTVAVILVLVYFKILKRITWQQLGLVFSRPLTIIRYGFLGGILLFIMVLGSGVVLEYLIPIEPDLQPFAQLVAEAKDKKDLIILLVMGSFLAPLSEELYFRGLVYPVFRNRWGVASGMLVSSVFFAILHFDPIRFLPLVLGGIGLAYIYERSGSIVSSIFAHGLWNGVMVCLLYLAG